MHDALRKQPIAAKHGGQLPPSLTTEKGAASGSGGGGQKRARDDEPGKVRALESQGTLLFPFLQPGVIHHNYLKRRVLDWFALYAEG